MNKNHLDNLVRNLPETPGIIGRAEYLNSAVLAPLVLIDREYHLLFQKRSATIRQPGEVCFPGGKHDPKQDADYRETAIRETTEELGIDASVIQVKGYLNTMMAPMGVIVEPFLAVLEIDDLSRLKPDPAEVERIFTVPVSYFLENEPDRYQIRVMAEPSYKDADGKEHILFPVKELNLPERYQGPWGSRLARILVYPHPEETIWGITAEIIDDLISYVKKSL